MVRELICVRCGYCCIRYDVIVPLPSTKKNIVVGAYKPSGERCWNLIYENDKATCKIHDTKLYKGCPCFDYVNDHREEECRIGVFMITDEKNKEQLEEIRNYPVAVPEPVELKIKTERRK